MNNIPSFRKYRNLIPLIIMAGLSIYTISKSYIGFVEFFKPQSIICLDIKHYLAFILLTICAITFYFYNVFYNHILCATLLLGLFSVINFLPFEHSWYLCISNFCITFQQSFVYIILLMCILNFEFFIDFFNDKKEDLETVGSDFSKKKI
jgi:hypothetical protein